MSTESYSKGLSREQFLNAILEQNPHADISRIGKAYDFAKEAHAGQKRISGEDFFEHSKECAYLVSVMKLDTNAITAAMLHDILEDTKTKPESIEKGFGREVLQLVEGVTKEVDAKAIKDKRAENIRKVLLATAKDVRVILIKLADRLHNMRTLKYLGAEMQKEISKETLQIYVPIAYKLGMYRIKSELEDLCLRYLQPEIYQQLKKKIDRKKGKRERDVARIVKAIRKLLGENGIEAKVYGRAKNFYSIYKKMIKKGLKFEEIHDLSAIRVIVKNTNDCYSALEAIHGKWKPIEGKLDDYIQNPKPNLYQSLHTEIIFDKKPVEVQVRTNEMHHIAEEGIAAHWQYKGTERDKKFDRRISWLKQILDWRSKETAHDLVESFKIDIFKDEIYVLTPKGDPIPLPEKATPVDFAFAVHTEIGEHCKAAKVNGGIQPLDHELKSGDVAEIITANNAKPSRQWLNFVKTAFAREKIRKALGIEAETAKAPSKRVITTEEIETGGEARLKLQKCCYIRKGEPIAGIKNKDGSMTVHSRTHCEVARRMPKDKLAELKWKSGQEKKQQLEVETADRTGIFADILSKLTSEDITVNSVNTKSAKNKLMLMLQVSSSEEKLRQIVPKLKQVKDVIRVNAV